MEQKDRIVWSNKVNMQLINIFLVPKILSSIANRSGFNPTKTIIYSKSNFDILYLSSKLHQFISYKFLFTYFLNDEYFQSFGAIL